MKHTLSSRSGLSRRSFGAGLASLASLGLPSLRAQTAGRVVLGQSAAFTGAAAQLGVQFLAGARLYFDQHNALGGGRPRIEIEAMDDGYEPERCVENTRKLLEKDVFALFGYIGTPTSVAAMPLAVRADVPFVAPFTGAMALRQPFNRMVFHLRASYHDETELIVRNLHTLGLSRVAVFYQNDAYGKAGLDGTVAALERRGLKPVALATVERNTVNVAPAVATINAAQPQAVVQISAYKSCAAYIRAARKAGYGGSFYNVSFVGTQALADELGAAGAGVVVSQVVPNPFSTARPITREFREAIEQDGNKVQANFSSLEGFIAARLFAEGLRRAGGRSGRAGLIEGLESIGDSNLSGYSVSLNARDHVASAFVELSMLTAEGKVIT